MGAIFFIFFIFRFRRVLRGREKVKAKTISLVSSRSPSLFFSLSQPQTTNRWVDEDADFFKQIGRFFGGGKKKEEGGDKKGGRK